PRMLPPTAPADNALARAPSTPVRGAFISLQRAWGPQAARYLLDRAGSARSLVVPSTIQIRPTKTAKTRGRSTAGGRSWARRGPAGPGRAAALVHGFAPT